MAKFENLTNGIIKENPVLVLLLGTCPTLAVTTSVKNGIGMGIASTAVLLCSNVVISLLKNIIPDKVRIPSYIVIVAGFVTMVGMLVEAYVPDLYRALGIFLPLITVNCIILGRAEMFASKNSIGDSALDGIGMGIGFTIALFFMGSIREIIGNGSWYGMRIPGMTTPINIFTAAPGGFFVFGCLIALVNKVTRGKAIKRKEFGCEGCPSAKGCQSSEKGGCEA